MAVPNGCGSVIPSPVKARWGKLVTEPPAGEHCLNLEWLSIPRVRSCPGWLVRSPVALMGCRAAEH